jgi:hypothetical protein
LNVVHEAPESIHNPDAADPLKQQNIAQPVARAACTQPIIAAPMPLVMRSRLRLRKLRRNDARRRDFGTAS